MGSVRNMAYRQAIYRREMQQFLATTLPWIFVVAIVAAFGLAYAVRRYVIGEEFDWQKLALLMMVGLIIPPILARLPRRPRARDIEIERAMRRSVGMDDSVDE